MAVDDLQAYQIWNTITPLVSHILMTGLWSIRLKTLPHFLNANEWTPYPNEISIELNTHRAVTWCVKIVGIIS